MWLKKILKFIFCDSSIQRVDEILLIRVNCLKDLMKTDRELSQLNSRIQKDFDRKINEIVDLKKKYDETFLFMPRAAKSIYMYGHWKWSDTNYSSQFIHIWEEGGYNSFVFERGRILSGFEIGMKSPDTLWIYDLCVGGKSKELQRLGFGTFAVKHLEKIALADECKKINGDISCHDFYSDHDPDWGNRLSSFWTKMGYEFIPPPSSTSHGKICKSLDF